MLNEDSSDAPMYGDPSYMEGVLKNYVKAVEDLEDDPIDIDLTDYIEGYTRPENKEEFEETLDQLTEEVTRA